MKLDPKKRAKRREKMARRKSMEKPERRSVLLDAPPKRRDFFSDGDTLGLDLAAIMVARAGVKKR